MRWDLLACVAVACAGCGVYHSGEVARTVNDWRQFECLEIGASGFSDTSSRSAAEASRLVAIEYRIGNVCREPTPVRLDRVRVFDADTGVSLTLFDPDQEVVGGIMDGGRNATEVLGYELPAGVSRMQVCVDLERASDNPVSAEPICFVWPPVDAPI